MSNTSIHIHRHPLYITQPPTTKNRGFTIVELLIVILVIAILAAISIVAYNGVQNRAYDTTVQSDLRQTYTRIQEYNIVNDTPFRVVSGTQTGAQRAIINSVFVTTRSAYATTGDTLLLCGSDDTITVVARSKSGNGFYYSTTLGLGSFTNWPGDGNVSLCPAAGVPTNATNYQFTWIKGGGGWESWFTAGK